MQRWILCLLLLALAVLSLEAQPVSVPRVVAPPAVDGDDNDAAWARAPSLKLAYRMGGGAVQAATAARVCFDEKAIYILFVCSEPTPERIVRSVRQRDGQVWTDDCVEVFLAPGPEEPGCYYHVVVNSLGVVRDEYWSDGKDDPGWNSAAQAKARIGSSRWIVEMALPFRSFARAPIWQDIWRANLNRSRPMASEQTGWQQNASGFHEPDRFGNIALKGVSALSSVREAALQAVTLQAEKLSRELAPFRKQIPKRPHSKLWQQAADTLDGWRSLLKAEAEPSRRWQTIRQVQREMQRWPSLVAQAKAADQRERLVQKLGQPYAIFSLSPMKKLRPDEVPDGEPAGEVRLWAAKGEGESAQLVIAALSQPLHGVSTKADLTGPNGYRISPEIHPVGYVPVTKPTPGGFGLAGRYPDPLLPPGEIEIKEGESQAIWVTVWVPRDAPAGEYRGAVAIAPANARPARIPFSLRVYDVSIPVQSALKTAVLIWNEGGSRSLYGDAWTPERLQRFYETGLRYRFTAPPPLPWDRAFVKQADGKWMASWDEFDQTVQAWMQKGATAFSIGGILRWGMNLPPEAEREETIAKLRLLGEHLRQRGWSERFYFYVFDEPPAGELGNIQRICAFVRQHAPNLRVLLTGFNPSFRALAGYIGIWVPHINQFDEPFMHERQTKGDQIWMYVCIGTVGTTYPDMWRIDWTGTAHRAVGWWLWRYRCEGFLYWCVDYWLDGTGKPFDLFASPMAFPGGNGDGFLFYPDPDRKEDPYPSIRAEIMRDGFEDYDLLILLQEALSQARAQKNPDRLLKQATHLLDAKAMIAAPNRFTQDPSVYERRHQAILETLERMKAQIRTGP